MTVYPNVDLGQLHDWRPRRLRKLRPRTPEVDVLARFNSEVQRGLLHSDEWRERMAVLQAEFDAVYGTGGTGEHAP